MGDDGSGDLVFRVARRIAARRREKGLTQEGLAARLDIAVKNLQRIESGGQNLSLETLERIAIALDTTPEELFVARLVDRPHRIPATSPLARLRRAGFGVRKPTDVGRRPRNAVPIMSLSVAAGRLAGAARAAEILGWVTLPTKIAPEAGFVAQVHGESMEPRIAAGALCLFRAPAPPPHTGRIVLVTHSSLADDDLGHFALKRIKSVRRLRSDRTRVVLESINRKFPPVTIESTLDDELRVLAELDRVLVR